MGKDRAEGTNTVVARVFTEATAGEKSLSIEWMRRQERWRLDRHAKLRAGTAGNDPHDWHKPETDGRLPTAPDAGVDQKVEEATMPDEVKKTTGRATRRKFLTGAAVAAVGTVAMPNVSRAQTTALTMQS